MDQAADPDEQTASLVPGLKDMRACLIIAACIAAWCFAAEPHAQDFPDTPDVWVREIGPTNNWVQVQYYPLPQTTVDLIGGSDEEVAMRSEELEQYSEKMWQQAMELGHFVCSLFDKQGVGLSQLTEGQYHYVLIACATH